MARLVKVYKHLNSFRDRHGKQRHYFRYPGKKPIKVEGDFGSYEFDANYEAAMAAAVGVTLPGESRIVKGTVHDLCAQYYQSYEFKSKREKTQTNYRRIIEKFRAAVGNIMVRAITAQHINLIKAAYVTRPGALRTMLKRLNTLFNFAKEAGFRNDNPMSNVKLPKEGPGFLPWSDDDIAMYEKKWGPGTSERLALYLCLYTAQRRSDVVKMGRQHVKNDVVSVVQQKTGGRVWIPLHSALKAELDRLPADQMMFLVNPRSKAGEARTSEGLGNWIRQCAKDAGILGTRGPHGLRKAACRRLIEAGCDGETARAISGHASEKEFAVYIRDVNQQILAKRAMEIWENNVVSIKPEDGDK